VGATRIDDIFKLDEIRTRLNATSVKLVLVPNADIRGAMEIVGRGRTRKRTWRKSSRTSRNPTFRSSGRSTTRPTSRKRRPSRR